MSEPLSEHFLRLVLTSLSQGDQNMPCSSRVVVPLRSDDEAKGLIAYLDSLGILSFQPSRVDSQRERGRYSCASNRVIAGVVRCIDLASIRTDVKIQNIYVFNIIATLVLATMFAVIYVLVCRMHHVMENCLQADI